MTSQYQAAQDADTPFARWRFEEAAGSTTFAEDVASASVTASGTVTAGVLTGDALDGPRRGVDLDSGAYLATGSVASAWRPFAVEALVTLDTVPSTSSTTRAAIFSHNYTAGNIIPAVLGFNLDAGHQGRLGFGWYDGGSWRAAIMTTALSTGVLHHIVGVRTGTTGVALWVDGVQVASATVTAFIAGTANAVARIGRRWDQPETIDGRVWDLALYSGTLSSGRIAAHYAAATAVAGVRISGGGKPTFPDGTPRIAGASLHLSGGGRPRLAAPSLLLVPGDGTTWTNYGELSQQPTTSSGGPGETWRYVADASGALAVDTAGTDWNTVVTVYASDHTTVLATDSTPGGAAAVSVSVTAGATYYVSVTRGTGADDDSGRYYINATGPRSSDAPTVESPAVTVATPPPTIPSAAPPPAGMTVVPIQRVSAVYPAPTIVDGRPQQPWTPTSVTRAAWGNFRVIMAGVDVTYFRGKPAIVESFELMEPFGCGPAVVSLPGITPHDAVGTGDTDWLRGGYYIDIVGPGGVPVWNGQIGKQVGQYDEERGAYVVECVGDIWLADLVGHQPRTYLPSVDVGSMVPVVLNLVPHRHVWGIAQVTTGIKTTQRGSADTSVIGYCQELLATAQTSGGGQWTIGRTGPRQYAMQLKDRTTVTWTVRTGTPGVQARLELDSTTAVNRIFGRGVAPNGYAWAGWVYPRTGVAAAAAYPNSSPTSVLAVGTSDASTTSGTGVTDWQRRMNELGYSVAVDGVYNAADAAAARRVQQAKGLTVDGITGPQTWAATFDVGVDGTDLTKAYRAPLAALPSATPLLTNADGSAGAANPSDNKSLIVVDRDEDFGDGVTKAEAITSAQLELARSSTPGWAGQIVLTADPEEISRFGIREGSNGLLKGWAGRDVTLHVAHVQVTPPGPGDDKGTVTLTVDEKARDLVTLGAILRRDKDAARTPAMLPPRKQRRSQSRPDSVVEYDGESSGGVIPRHALYGGLWTVIRIPVSQAGKVAQVIAQTSPASPFALAFFGDAVTPADLRALVGNPLADRLDGYGPYDEQSDKLAARGFIDALGGPGQACGYSPGYETSPHTGTATPLTGKLLATGAWTYQSAKPPWLWLAEYATTSTFFSGRIYPAPIDT